PHRPTGPTWQSTTHSYRPRISHFCKRRHSRCWRAYAKGSAHDKPRGASGEHGHRPVGGTPRGRSPQPQPALFAATAPGGSIGQLYSPAGGFLMSQDSKIRSDHFRRAAVVYVRQSTLNQVRGNRESGARQYALADRAQALGWPAAAVQTIDDDQGRSGTHAGHRQGFKKLLAEIGAGQVGLVLALEASRLARSSIDWH